MLGCEANFVLRGDSGLVRLAIRRLSSTACAATTKRRPTAAEQAPMGTSGRVRGVTRHSTELGTPVDSEVGTFGESIALGDCVPDGSEGFAGTVGRDSIASVGNTAICLELLEISLWHAEMSLLRP